MKQEFFYKIGLGVYLIFQVYYSYWFLTIHKKLKNIKY